MTTPANVDEACVRCGTRPRLRTCHGCGASAVLTDCGHMIQPRPIAAGREDGTEGHHDFCTKCAPTLDTDTTTTE